MNVSYSSVSQPQETARRFVATTEVEGVVDTPGASAEREAALPASPSCLELAATTSAHGRQRDARSVRCTLPLIAVVPRPTMLTAIKKNVAAANQRFTVSCRSSESRHGSRQPMHPQATTLDGNESAR